jgi:hypothetical protein
MTGSDATEAAGTADVFGTTSTGAAWRNGGAGGVEDFTIAGAVAGVVAVGGAAMDGAAEVSEGAFAPGAPFLSSRIVARSGSISRSRG